MHLSMKKNKMDQKLTLITAPYKLAICRLDKDAGLPDWLKNSREFYSVTKTADELSIVALDSVVPKSSKADRGWCALMVEGPLDFSLTGILASLLEPLAKAKISIFAISTFDTDYLLVKESDFEKSITVLSEFCNIKKEKKCI